MNDSHVLEEMRSMRGTHGELLGEMRELCGSVRELTLELKHTQRNFDSLDVRVGKAEGDIKALQLESALNKPILDIARAMNTKMWVSLIGAAATVGGVAMYGQNLIGT